MLTASDITRIKTKITNALQKHANVAPARTTTLLPIKSLQGKLYEADILAQVCEKLVTKEGHRVRLKGGSRLILKQKGGVIDRGYPFFEVLHGTTIIAELFTDIYFATLSYFIKGSSARKVHGDYHELDIALLLPNLNGYPRPEDILLAIECKNTSIKKSIIREVLGFRRELSFYSNIPQATIFSVWPSNQTNSNPSSIHMLYCSDRRISRYTANCLQFGIVLQFYKM